MQKQTVAIVQQARPARPRIRQAHPGRLRSSSASVFLSRNGRRVNAKSIMGVMMLAAGKGATVDIETDGADEEAAMTALVAADRRQVRRRRMSSNVSFTMHGIGVSGGIAIGHVAPLLQHARLEVDALRRSPAPTSRRELRRYDRAVKQVQRRAADASPTASQHSAAARTRRLRQRPPHAARRLDAVADAPRDIIRREKLCNAEWALKLQLDELLAHFADVQDEYLRERRNRCPPGRGAGAGRAGRAGQRGVPEKLRGRARGYRGSWSRMTSRQLTCSYSSDHQFAGFVTDVGGQTSHTAIMARSLRCPRSSALHHARQPDCRGRAG